MDLPDGAVDVVLPLLQGRMGIERVDQDQRPLVADAHALAVAPVGQHGVVAEQVAPGDLDGIVVQGRQHDAAALATAKLLDQVAQRHTGPAVFARQAQRRGQGGGDVARWQPLQSLQVAGLCRAVARRLQSQHAAALGGWAHWSGVGPQRQAQAQGAQQGHQGSACAGPQGRQKSEQHRHHFHIPPARQGPEWLQVRRLARLDYARESRKTGRRPTENCREMGGFDNC